MFAIKTIKKALKRRAREKQILHSEKEERKEKAQKMKAEWNQFLVTFNFLIESNMFQEAHTLLDKMLKEHPSMDDHISKMRNRLMETEWGNIKGDAL